ncbi:uncharacterized protein L969DRAFT_47621 [Mixia osmundae IAM 14324]|uniref:Phospholipid/glycerol acyltransferase domain-containing protein n=1 Tax=Mixia osmundae (strain CBS 9802 / IAM 14324 / JCM 22182 / KY 12970) TaxID=764103 RepID=G7E912_MIXOS|nr:uncharacterized protein L969DRAFT_47621 [Mixia osmundae IAM 14324]KEI40266.1 hypothetical protein L969DRAFT_47621 [Mixia osmundae IAM 14324]GAA99630.1 hypothetical protein E5Q_06331 [Mixia osmundae IAM 14324]
MTTIARTTAGQIRLISYALSIFSYGIIANILFTLSLLVLPFSDKLAYECNSSVAGTLWRYMQWLFESRAQAEITFSGDTLPSKESALVISNHLAYSDYYLIHALALRKGMLRYCRYFAKDSLKWTLPIFGLSLKLVGMVMVKRNWTSDAANTRKAFAQLKRGRNKPVWLVTYLEGTRITPKKLAESQRFCKSADKPTFDNVLYPRMNGFVAAISELRDSQVEHVYDFTLAYAGAKGEPQKPASLATVFQSSQLSPPYKFHVHVRREAVPRQKLPRADADIMQICDTRPAANRYRAAVVGRESMAGEGRALREHERFVDRFTSHKRYAARIALLRSTCQTILIQHDTK